jgi:hypothetical protein
MRLVETSPHAEVDAVSPTATQLSIAPWPDPVIDRIGHDPRSPYVERFWLSILGPSTTFLLRHLAGQLETDPEGFVLDLPTTARAMGLGDRTKVGKQSPFLRALSRTCHFGLARLVDDVLVVRRRMPPLTSRQVERLPEPLQVEHQQWQQRQRGHGPHAAAAIEQMRERARRLALTLLELGEDLETTERQLHRWRFHPSVAYEAVRWAQQEKVLAAAERASS